MAGEISDPYQQILEAHDPNATVLTPGGVEMTLGSLVMMEKRFCKPKSEERHQDPHVRAEFLAVVLNGGNSLLPEFVHLLPTPVETE